MYKVWNHADIGKQHSVRRWYLGLYLTIQVLCRSVDGLCGVSEVVVVEGGIYEDVCHPCLSFCAIIVKRDEHTCNCADYVNSSSTLIKFTSVHALGHRYLSKVEHNVKNVRSAFTVTLQIARLWYHSKIEMHHLSPFHLRSPKETTKHSYLWRKL